MLVIKNKGSIADCILFDSAKKHEYYCVLSRFVFRPALGCSSYTVISYHNTYFGGFQFVVYSCYYILYFYALEKSSKIKYDDYLSRVPLNEYFRSCESITLCPKCNLLPPRQHFLMLAFLRSASFWPPAMVYIYVIITHIHVTSFFSTLYYVTSDWYQR